MTITTEDLPVPGIRLLTPKVHIYRRGSFHEKWNQRDLDSAGIRSSFVQDNHVVSHAVGTLRRFPTLADWLSKSALDLDHRNTDDYDDQGKLRQEDLQSERVAL